jgi:hypothetical protein
MDWRLDRPTGGKYGGGDIILRNVRGFKYFASACEKQDDGG